MCDNSCHFWVTRVFVETPLWAKRVSNKIKKHLKYMDNNRYDRSYAPRIMFIE